MINFLYTALIWIIAKSLMLLFILGGIGFIIYLFQMMYYAAKGKSIGRFPFWLWL